MKKLATFLFFLIFFLYPTLQVEAIEYGSIGAKPANPTTESKSEWFIYNLDLGEQIEDTLLVINNGPEELDIIIYPADSIKSSSGGFALKQMAEKMTNVGSWIRLYPDPIPNEFAQDFEEKDESILQFCALELEGSQEWCEGIDIAEVKVDARERIEIPFIFSMPERADSGEHTGGILIQKVESEDFLNREGGGISLTTRVGVRIYQTVPGDVVSRLYIDDFKVIKQFNEFDYSRIFSDEYKIPEHYFITTKIGNSGNKSTYFNQTIEITDDLFNRRNETIEDREFSVLRNDVFDSNYSWNNPRFGKFTFQTTITYLDEEDIQRELESEPVSLWVIPWREIALSIAIVFFVFLLNKTITTIQKQRYAGKGWKTYTVKENDTIEKIMDKYNIKWKTFIKTNKLKPPYTIKKGDKIRTPSKKL